MSSRPRRGGMPASPVRSACPAPSAQRGQALGEFLVVALALVPLFLLLPLIGKYQDIAHHAQAASRYAAFATASRWGQDPGSLADEVRRRYFNRAATGVRTGEAGSDATADRVPLWNGPGGAPLLARLQDVAVAVETPALRPATAYGAQGRLGLDDTGLQRAAITVPLDRPPAGLNAYQPLNTLDLTIRRHTSVLPNSWTARDSADTRGRVERQLSPPSLAAGGVAAVASAQSVLGPFGRLLEGGHLGMPEAQRLDRWDDVVPADRLVPTSP